MGRGEKSNLLYIIDFGLAKYYCDPDTKIHIPPRKGKSLTGTARYASIKTHLGFEQSRRDDIEGMLYVILYFLRGNLPWQGLPGKTKIEKYNNIMNKKTSTTVEELCKGFPGMFIEETIDEFQTLIQYARDLKFEENPDYLYIKDSLLAMFERYKFVLDNKFDWYNKMLSIKNSTIITAQPCIL